MKNFFLTLTITVIWSHAALSMQTPEEQKAAEDEKAAVIKQLSDFIVAHDAHQFIMNMPNTHILKVDDWGNLWVQNNSQIRNLQSIQKTYWFGFLWSAYRERETHINAHYKIHNHINRKQQTLAGY